MSQGGYGGGNPGGGGGWGPPPGGGGGWGPPGGAPPPGGGYGAPPGGGAPGGGYGAPPGSGGWGPPGGAPPAGGGYGPPQGAPPPYGAPPGGPPGYGPPPGAPFNNNSGNYGRFAKTAIIGGVIGGILSAIPLFNVLNCCFCMLNMIGAWIGISMYLKQNEGEKITNGEAAVSGAISGAVAGLIAGIAGFLTWLALAATITAFLRTLSPQLRDGLTNVTAGGVSRIFTTPLLYAGFGALAGFLSMQFFNKDRLKS